MSFIIGANADCSPPETLKAMGYTHTRIDVIWPLSELNEGRLSLDGVRDKLESADTCGLRVILRVDLRDMPPWLGDKYPESRRGHDTVCPFYPGVMSDTLFFVRALVKELSKYSAIDMWELSVPLDASACKLDCDAAVYAFRNHLRSVCTSIKTFNDRYGLDYLDFTDVYPVTCALRQEFTRFLEAAPGVRLAEIAWAISEGDPSKRKVLYMTPQLTPEGAQHRWDESFDTHARTGEFLHMLRIMDKKRTMMNDEKPLLPELFFPRGFMGLYNPTEKDAVRAFAATVLGGANGFIAGEGANESVLRALASLGRALGEAPPLDKPRVLIVPSGAQGEMGFYAERAYHKLLTLGGAAVDIGMYDSGKYDLVIWPLCASPDVEVLKTALDEGTHLLIEALPSLLADEPLCALMGVTPEPARLISEPEERRFMPTPSFEGEYLPPSILSGTGMLDSDALRASVYAAGLHCAEGTQPLFTLSGKPVVVSRTFGQSKAVLAATCLSFPMSAHGDMLSHAALRGLLGVLGIKSAQAGLITRSRGGVELSYDLNEEVFTTRPVTS